MTPEEKGKTEVTQKLYNKVICNPDVSAFYNKDGEVMIPFHKISLATQEDYDAFRKEACKALTNG